MSKQENNDVVIPAGFEKVSDGKLAAEWDFNANPAMQGVVTKKKAVQCVQQGKPAVANMMAIDVGGTVHVVWEAATLKDLFDDCVVGDTVFIQFTGLENLGDGRQPMKMFTTALKKTGHRDGSASA